MGLFLGWVLAFCSSCGCGFRRPLSGIFSPVCRGYRAQPSDHKPAQLRASLRRSLLKVIAHVSHDLPGFIILILSKDTRCSVRTLLRCRVEPKVGCINCLYFFLQASHTFFSFRPGATEHCDLGTNLTNYQITDLSDLNPEVTDHPLTNC